MLTELRDKAMKVVDELNDLAMERTGSHAFNYIGNESYMCIKHEDTLLWDTEGDLFADTEIPEELIEEGPSVRLCELMLLEQFREIGRVFGWGLITESEGE